MIARIWRGWTAPADTDAFQHLMCDTLIPEFEAREVAGLMQIDLLRQTVPPGDGEVEFTTVMLFDTIEAIRRFGGDNATLAHVPPAAAALLVRYDTHTVLHDVIDRRSQDDRSRGRA